MRLLKKFCFAGLEYRRTESVRLSRHTKRILLLLLLCYISSVGIFLRGLRKNRKTLTNRYDTIVVVVVVNSTHKGDRVTKPLHCRHTVHNVSYVVAYITN